MQVYRITYPEGSTAHRPATITQPLPAGLPRGSRVELVEITRARVTVLAELPVIGGRAFARELDEAERARMEAAYPWPREIPAGETREEWLRREIAWWLEDTKLGRFMLAIWRLWKRFKRA